MGSSGINEAVHGMTDEEAERMLQRLESEAQIKGDGVEKEMTMGRERLRRKLLAKQKMLKEKASLLLDQCDDEDEEEKITRDLENELDALENQANANKLHFQQQFTNDQQKQSDKMKARLQKKYNKKMAKLNKSKKKN